MRSSPQEPVTGSHGAGVTAPPWELRGHAALVLLRAQQTPSRGLASRIGALAFVAYETSPVGPYLELLHVPRVTHGGGRLGPTVDRIWVTSATSVVSGRENWGLPKDLAHVTHELATPRGEAEVWTATQGDTPLASLALRVAGPAVPVVKPAGLGRLLQRSAGVRFATPIGLTASIRWARLTTFELGPELAELRRARVLGALVLPRFRMRFGAPETTRVGGPDEAVSPRP